MAQKINANNLFIVIDILQKSDSDTKTLNFSCRDKQNQIYLDQNSTGSITKQNACPSISPINITRERICSNHKYIFETTS